MTSEAMAAGCIMPTAADMTEAAEATPVLTTNPVSEVRTITTTVEGMTSTMMRSFAFLPSLAAAGLGEGWEGTKIFQRWTTA